MPRGAQLFRSVSPRVRDSGAPRANIGDGVKSGADNNAGVIVCSIVHHGKW